MNILYLITGYVRAKSIKIELVDDDNFITVESNPINSMRTYIAMCRFIDSFWVGDLYWLVSYAIESDLELLEFTKGWNI